MIETIDLHIIIIGVVAFVRADSIGNRCVSVLGKLHLFTFAISIALIDGIFLLSEFFGHRNYV